MKPNPFTTISHEVKMTAAEKAAMKSRLLTVMRGGTIERSHHTQPQPVTEHTQPTQPTQPIQPAQLTTIQSLEAQPAVAPVDTTAPTLSPITVTKSFWKTTDFKLATTAAALAMCTLFVVFFSDSIVTGITTPRAKTTDPVAESDMVAPMMATVETAPSLVKMAELETTPVTTTPQPITRKVPASSSAATTTTTTAATGASAIRMMPTTTTPAVTSNYAPASPTVAGSYSIAQTTTVIPSFDVSAYSEKVDLLEGWNDSICADPKKETLCKQVQNTIYTIRKLLIDTTYADDPDLVKAKQLISQLEKNTSFISPADLAKLYL